MAKRYDLEYMPTALKDVCAVKMGNKIYIFGGRDSISPVNTIYVYDIESNTYTTSSWTLPNGLYKMCGCSTSDTIYLFGGYDNNDDPNLTAYKFTLSNGVQVASADPVNNNPTNAYLYVEQGGLYPQIVLSSKSDTFLVYDLDTSGIASYTDSLLGTVYNFYTMKYWMSLTSNTIKLYKADDLLVGDYIRDVTIPEVYDSIEKIEEVDEYTFIIISVKNDVRTVWRYDAYYNVISKQYTFVYDAYSGIATDFNKHLYLFGGVYGDLITPTDDLFMYDFNYYEIRLLYSSGRLSLSNTATEITLNERYANTISPINSGNNKVTYNVHGTYGSADISQYVTYDGENSNIAIDNVRSDIYLNLTSEYYHINNMFISDGVTLNNNSNEWRRYTDFVRTFTLSTGYTLNDVKILNGSTNITSLVYDPDTKTITLDHTYWNAYNDISIFITSKASTIKLNFYRNFSLDNVVEKNIVSIGEASGDMREDISILNPSILIDTSSIDISQANYVYIENFKRYYYITSMDIVRTNLWRINLRVDVLMSYKDYILDLSCFVSRSASDYNKRLADAEDIIGPDPVIEIQEVKNDIFDVETTTGTDHILVIASN